MMKASRALPVLLAALGLPLNALAQSPDNGSEPAPLSGVTVTARTSVDLSGITVVGGCAVIPPDETHNAREWNPAPSAAPRAGPSPGTLEFLEKTITMFARQTAYDPATAPKMDIALARATEVQFRVLSSWVKCRGAPKSIKFLHVSELGYDDYEVDFANGAIEWEVAPLRYQAVYQTDFRYFYPQPASRQLVELLKSMERGKPNYADLTPELAATVQAQWPALQMSLKGWGGLESIYFLRHGDDGSYVYVVSFKHRQVVCEVTAADANSKLTGLKFAEAPG
jgi:hypothetical protein